MEDEFFKNLKEKLNNLEKETNKNKMRKLIIDVIVDLKKFCHRDDVDIHGVLHDARQRCKEEIDKPY